MLPDHKMSLDLINSVEQSNNVLYHSQIIESTEKTHSFYEPLLKIKKFRPNSRGGMSPRSQQDAELDKTFDMISRKT